MHIYHHHLKGAVIRNASKLLHEAACTHHVLKHDSQSGAGAGKYPEISWQVTKLYLLGCPQVLLLVLLQLVLGWARSLPCSLPLLCRGSCKATQY